MDSDTFVYEIEIPKTTAKITFKKEDFIKHIEETEKWELSQEKKNEAWDEIKWTGDWYRMFPRHAESRDREFKNKNEQTPCDCGNHRDDKRSDKRTYTENFKEDVEKAIQTSIDKNFSDNWKDYFYSGTYETILAIHSGEDVKWKNLDTMSQKNLQAYNLLYGEKPCLNETKAESIRKASNTLMRYG